MYCVVIMYIERQVFLYSNNQLACVVYRDLETRMGTTPPPSPSDKMDHVALNARVVQLSNEVDQLKKLLSKTESKRENFKSMPL